jgi:hypothetical protein
MKNYFPLSSRLVHWHQNGANDFDGLSSLQSY